VRIFLQRTIWVVSLIVFLFVLETIFVNCVDFSEVRIPAGYPTKLASPTSVGTVLLVADHAPAIYRPSHYEYVMPEEQQRRILREAPLIRLGQTVDSVVEKLGPPLFDELGWGPKAPIYFFLPRMGIVRPTRCLKYYFAERNLNGSNESDPSLQFFFDKNGTLIWLASNVDRIPDVGGFPSSH